MTHKIGILTIGQSPRTDMTPEMEACLPGYIEIVEMGALDGLNKLQLKQLAPQTGDITLISRLQDGGTVKISEEAVLPLLQEKIRLLEDTGTKTIIIACTGSFPPFESRYPLLYPDRVLFHFIYGVLPKGKLGVIVPLPEQSDDIRQKWERDGLDLAVEAASPYHQGTDIERAAMTLKEKQADCIVLDCMGYSRAMKKRVKKVTGLPVVLSRSVVATAAAELV